MGGPKCPLLPLDAEGRAITCGQEICAWWSDADERCAVTALANTLHRLLDTVKDVATNRGALAPEG